MEMKEVFENLIKIVEDAKGSQGVMEQEFKKYYDINKKVIDESGEKMKLQMEAAMKNIPNPQDLGKVMQEMMNMMSKMVGEDNFKKMMDLQNQYPFLKDMSKIFMPAAK